LDPQKFLNSLINYEKTPSYGYSLINYGKYLEKIGSPQKKLSNVIHIAGTKGKGSTAVLINSCLISNGYSVGLFTSPHLKELNERISVNNVRISDRNLENTLKKIKPYIKDKKGIRTYFEVLTTIVFFHFLTTNVSFSILEAGLGGRLDATNVTKPIISVITKIGYDHTNLLGNNLAQIASEKAGIIKEKCRLITIHQRNTVEKIIKRTVHNKGGRITYAEDLHKIKILNQSIKGSRLKIKGELGSFEAFLPLAGSHQIENLQITLAVLSELKKMGFKITNAAIKLGISKTILRGRFDIISEKPLIIFDCAHNQDSFQALHNNLNRLSIENFNLIFGTSMDKDIRYCLKYIFPEAKEVVLVKADNPRAMDPIEIHAKARKYQKNITIGSSVREGIQYFRVKSNDKTAILIAGSFYLWPL
jgi:dihydrofolate synthase/folylpolyglutamate synthase